MPQYDHIRLSDADKFESFICDLFNELEKTRSYKLCDTKTRHESGLDIFSDETQTAVRCEVKNPQKASANLFREMVDELERRIEFPLQKGIKFKRFVLVSTYGNDEILSQYIQVLRENKNYHFQIEYWGWDTIARHIKKHEHLIHKTFANTLPPLPKYLTAVPSVPKGFDKKRPEIEKIQQLLDAKKNQRPIVLVHPVKGNAKTSIAAFVAQNNRFDHIAWANAQNDIMLSLVHTLFNSPFRFYLDKTMPLKEKFRHLCKRLTQVPGNNLLIIDQIENTAQIAYIQQEIRTLNWNVLLLSQKQIHGFSNIPVKEVSPEKAQKLFYSDFRGSANEHAVARLLEHSDHNPFLIRFFSQKISRSPLDIGKLYEIVSAALRRTPHLKNYIDPHAKPRIVRRQRNVLKLLLAVYESEMKTFSPTEKQYLRYLALMPQGLLPFERLTTIFGIKKSHTTGFSAQLLDLAAKGYLQIHKKHFAVHPLVQAVLHKKLKPSPFNSRKLLEKLVQLSAFTSFSEFEQRQIYLPYMLSVLEKMTKADQGVAALAQNAAVMLRQLNAMNLAQHYIDLAIRALEHIHQTSEYYHEEIAIQLALTFAEQAEIYRQTGSYPKAIEFRQKAIALIEPIYGDEHLKLADQYKELAVLFFKNEQDEKAIELIDKALDIYKEQLPENTPRLLEALNVQEHISFFYERNQ